MSGLVIREAGAADLEAIVGLFAADAVGGHDDGWSAAARPAYEAAFAAIRANPDNALFVAVEDGAVIGTFQLTVIPGLSDRGALRARVGGVQVRADRRSHGIGAAMMAFAEGRARARGAATLFLTSNKHRTAAHRFYERLGYARSHEGFTKAL